MLTGRERESSRPLPRKSGCSPSSKSFAVWWPGSDRANERSQAIFELLAGGTPRANGSLPGRCSRSSSRFSGGSRAEDPAFGEYSWTLQKRWAEPAREVTLYLATRRAASIFGGRADGKIKNPSQVTHDIHLGALYLKLAERPRRSPRAG